MFAVVFPRTLINIADSVTIAEHLPKLEDALAARSVSGDIVVHQDSKTVVESDDWLFEWEKKTDNCFAKRAMKNSN